MQKFLNELSTVWNDFSEETQGYLARTIVGLKDKNMFSELLNEIDRG